MANPKLTVEIDADVSRMEKELSKANKLLAQHERNYAGVQKAISSNTQTARKLERQISSLSNEFKSGTITEKQYARETDRLSQELREVNSSTSNYQRELRRLENEMQRARNSTDSFNQTTERTNTAVTRVTNNTQASTKAGGRNAAMWTEVGRAVGDAQYGMVGMANNLQQIAFLAGAGGAVTIAISAVTALMAAFQGEIANVINQTDKLKDTLRDAAASAQGEIAVINSLMGVLNDETASRQKRNQAVQILQDKYPSYLSNLNAENATTQEIKTAVDQLTTSLEQRAKVQAATSLITEKAQELFKERIELAEDEEKAVQQSLANQSQAQNAYARGLNTANNNTEKSDAQTQERIRKEFASRLKDQEDEYNRFVQSLNKMVGETENLFDLFGDPTGSVGGGTADPVRVPIEPVLNTGALGATSDLQLAKDIMGQISALEQLQKTLPETSNEYAYLGNQIDFLKERLSNFNSSLVESGEVGAEELRRIGEGLTAFSESQQAQLLAQQEAFAERQKMIAGLVGNAFAQVSNQMVDLAMEGKLSFDDLAKSVVKSVTRILTTLAAQAIGNAIVGATQASTAAGPAAPLVLPGLIVGMTGAVNNAFPKFADGGIVGGNSLYGDKILARVNSQELILNRQQQAAVWGQMNTGASMGQSAPIEIVGSTVVEGENLRVILERNNRNRGRQT